MLNFFNYSFLGTFTGAVTATILMVQFLRDIKYLKNLSERWIVVFAAESLVILTSIFTGDFKTNELLLHFLNGLLVAVSAMGSLQVLQNHLSNNIYQKQESQQLKKTFVLDESAGKHLLQDKQLP